ncbi:MAG: peptidoglycan DD-metalloendopeptidase family protein [Rhodocyclales bacterium]|nr:peptidoglycan DD-metalloendopeptidase family protein [Rhodocyclales bacterium]
MKRGCCKGCFTFHVSLFTIALALLAASPAQAASIEGKKEELQDLKGRIESLRREVAAAEETRSHAADQLREAESSISNVNRRLHELAEEGAALRGELANLDAQGQRLDRQSGSQQNQLARLLNRQFVGGDADAMKLLLAGRDPNQAARDQYFLNQLSRAKAEMIQQLRSAAEEKKQLAEKVRERQAQLARIEQQQQEQRAQLLERKKQRQTRLVAIADKLKAQRREIDSLRRDEQRLTRLIDGLIRIAAARKPKSAGKGKPGPAPKTSALKSHDPGNVGGAFAALRGRLRLPVKGSVAGRFGTPRPEGGALWKGIFIRATEGAEVRAVGEGTVVFSDWLRGFGNLLVIDHGDDFLSVYGNNESLLAAVGAAIKNGQAVATVGNSGGNPESGLYFELRHRGLAFDPLKWAGNP